MKRLNILYVFIVLALMLAFVPNVSASPAAAVSCDQTYTVTAGDWLSKLSDKFLGGITTYWAIMAQTNYKNAEDSSFTKITNPDVLEVGNKLCIPAKADADAILAKFGDPKKGNVSVLFASLGSGQLLAGNWWTSAGEFAAINAVYTLYRQQYPGVELIHAGVAGGGGVNFKGATLTKLQGGDPYDVFQLHAGLEVVQYDPEKYLSPVEDIINAGEGTVIPQDLKDLLTYKGHMWTVPMNIHHGNVLWINKKIFADNGLSYPTTFDEFFKVADALKAKGIVALSMGGSEGFEQSQTFETVLIGTLGGQGVKGLWTGKTSWKDPKVADALNTYKKYLTYTNSDRDALSWDQASKLVINGQAAMNIMGDWADGEFIAAKKTAADYTGIPAPGNKGAFLLVSDGFALPLKSANHDNAVNFLKLVTTKEAQEGFNIKKGSICARTDCDYTNFDDYLKSSAAEFKTDIIVPVATHGSAAVPSWATAFGDIIKKFSADGDVAAAQAALVQAATDAGFPQ
jgi:glucose/mannose transport system substrate-binding protein